MFFIALLFSINLNQSKNFDNAHVEEENIYHAGYNNDVEYASLNSSHIHDEYCNHDVDANLYSYSTSSVFEVTGHNQNVMSAYFSKMSYNFGNNVRGSCGYVAMEMLLQYYDTYWNNEITPTSYDTTISLPQKSIDSIHSSPGSTYEYVPSDIIDQELTTHDEYVEYLEDNYYYSSLHAKLIVDYATGGVGVNQYTFENVLVSYLEENYQGNFEYIRSPVGASSNEVREWVIEQIVVYGRPVMLGYPGHVIIAYEYDVTSDNIYCHYGWHNNSEYYHKEISSNQTYSDAHTLVFSGNHVHSMKYNYDGAFYCHCMLNSHIHHLYGSSIYTNSHDIWCYCGYTSTGPHILYIFSRKPTIIRACECGYITIN